MAKKPWVKKQGAQSPNPIQSISIPRHLGAQGSSDQARALDNGLALTPPMGWMTWQRYRCETNCSGEGAQRCINEDLIKEMADRMAEAYGRWGLWMLGMGMGERFDEYSRRV